MDVVRKQLRSPLWYRIVDVLFAALILLALLLSIFHNIDPSFAADTIRLLIFAASGCVIIFVFLQLATLIPESRAKLTATIAFIVFFVFIALQVMAVYYLQEEPAFTLGGADSAYHFAKAQVVSGSLPGGALPQQDFGMYGLYWLYLSLLKLLGVTNYTFFVALLGLAAIDLSLYFLLKMVRSVFGEPQMLCAAVLFLLCMPFYLAAVGFGAQTLAMPFIMGGLWLWQTGRQAWRNGETAQAAGYYIGLSLLCGVGTLLYYFVLIVWAAVTLDMLILLRGSGRVRMMLGGFALLLAVFVGGYTGIWFGLWPGGDAAQTMPLSSSFYAGLQMTQEGYEQDFAQLATLPDKAVQSEASWQGISDELSEMGVGGFLKHLLDKLSTLFGDGTYGATSFLVNRHTQQRALPGFLQPSSSSYAILWYLSYMFASAMLFWSLVCAIKAIIRKNDYFSYVRGVFMVLVLLLLVWPSTARDIMAFLPLLILCTIEAAQRPAEKSAKRRSLKDIIRASAGDMPVSQNTGQWAAIIPGSEKGELAASSAGTQPGFAAPLQNESAPPVRRTFASAQVPEMLEIIELPPAGRGETAALSATMELPLLFTGADKPLEVPEMPAPQAATLPAESPEQIVAAETVIQQQEAPLPSPVGGIPLPQTVEVTAPEVPEPPSAMPPAESLEQQFTVAAEAVTQPQENPSPRAERTRSQAMQTEGETTSEISEPSSILPAENPEQIVAAAEKVIQQQEAPLPPVEGIPLPQTAQKEDVAVPAIPEPPSATPPAESPEQAADTAEFVMPRQEVPLPPEETTRREAAETAVADIVMPQATNLPHEPSEKTETLPQAGIQQAAVPTPPHDATLPQTAQNVQVTAQPMPEPQTAQLPAAEGPEQASAVSAIPPAAQEAPLLEEEAIPSNEPGTADLQPVEQAEAEARAMFDLPQELSPLDFESAVVGGRDAKTGFVPIDELAVPQAKTSAQAALPTEKPVAAPPMMAKANGHHDHIKQNEVISSAPFPIPALVAQAEAEATAEAMQFEVPELPFAELDNAAPSLPPEVPQLIAQAEAEADAEAMQFAWPQRERPIASHPAPMPQVRETAADTGKSPVIPQVPPSGA